jgi:hypothetical protein
MSKKITMKKIAIILSVFSLITNSCGQSSKKQAEPTNETISEQNSEIVIKENSNRKVKYYFRANGGQGIFFDDGTAYICARCELEEKLENYKPNCTYTEFSTYLLIDGEVKWELYDESGRVAIDWVIVNYRSIESTDENLIDIGLTFINSYIDNCNKRKEAIEIVEWTNSNSLVTNRFKAELTKIIQEAYENDPEMGLGFDPILDGQDYPDQGFELEHFDSGTNYLTVKGKDWSEFKLIIRLVNENANWLIDGCGIVNVPSDKRIER